MSDWPDYTLPVSIEGVAIESIPINIVAQTIGNLAIDIAAQTVGNLAVNIAASAVTLNIQTAAGEYVSTAIIASIQLDVNVAASAVTLNVDITAQTVGNLTVDLAAQTMGNLAIDIAAQSLGNVAISIAAQVVDLNIKTSGGTNIVIDKLTQAAFLGRYVYMSNGPTTGSFAAPTGTNRKGKFYPRGCRGFIGYMDVYCQDAGASGGTITVYLSPYVGAGPVYSGTITVPAGYSLGARFWNVAQMWNYDSLFIWFVCSSADIQVVYDTTGTTDGYTSSDSGATWAFESRRYRLDVGLYGQTVGDLPVSGTLNVIEIPNMAVVAGDNVAVNVPAVGELYVLWAEGVGVVTECMWLVSGEDNCNHFMPMLKVDGSKHMPFRQDIRTWGTTYLVDQWGSWYMARNDTANHVFLLVWRCHLPFKRKFEIGGENTDAGAVRGGYVWANVEKLS